MPTLPELSGAEIREIREALEKAQHDAEAIADQLEDRFQRAIVKAQAHAAERIGNILAQAPDFNSLNTRQRMAWWVEHQRAIEEALVNSGYSNAVAGYVNALPKFVEIVKATIAAAGDEFIIFPKRTLDFLRARQVSQFGALGVRANTALQDLLYSQVFTGSPKRTMLPALKSTITGKYDWGAKQGLYEWHAGTYARTNHFKYLAELDAAQADAHGLTANFLYVGPVDEKTRPFCRRLIASPRTYTKAEITAMDNGFRTTHPEVATVFTSRGGFNCRHRWLSVTPTLAKKLADRQPEATAQIERFTTTGPDLETPSAGFIEAKTIAQAEKWARENRLATQLVDYRGFKVSFANQLNREMAMLLREFPGVKLDFIGTEAAAIRFWSARRVGIPATDIARGMFIASPIGGRWPRTISFPAQFYADQKSINGTIAFIDKLVKKNWMAPYQYDDRLRRVIYHEFGHALDFERRVLTSSQMEALVKKWEKLAGGEITEKWVKDNLCEYAAAVPAELFSEGFAEYILSTNPRPRVREVAELLLRMHGRGTKKP